MRRIFGFLLTTLLLWVVWSCQNDNLQTDTLDDATLKSATVALTDNKLELALSEVEYESDFFSGMEKMLWKGHFGGMKWGWKDFGHYNKGKGPDITLGGSTTTYPKTITLDYGDSTVIHHGRVLSGKVIIEISAAPRTDGATRKITYQNLVIDSVTVNGTAVSVFKGDNLKIAAENYSENIVFVTGDGKEISWKGEKVRKWVEGLGTDTVRSDDVIEITGKVDASVKGGSTYLKEMTVPLIRKGSCRYIVSGVIRLTIDKTLVSSVDYGNGDCDATATLNKDGTTVTLDLTKNKAEKDWPHHRHK